MTDATRLRGDKYSVSRALVVGAIAFPVSPEAYHHQVDITAVAGNPNAGTLAISGRHPGASVFSAITGATINMANPAPVQFDGYFEELQATPSGYNGSSYDINATGGQ